MEGYAALISQLRGRIVTVRLNDTQNADIGGASVLTDNSADIHRAVYQFEHPQTVRQPTAHLPKQRKAHSKKFKPQMKPSKVKVLALNGTDRPKLATKAAAGFEAWTYNVARRQRAQPALQAHLDLLPARLQGGGRRSAQGARRRLQPAGAAALRVPQGERDRGAGGGRPGQARAQPAAQAGRQAAQRHGAHHGLPGRIRRGRPIAPTCRGSTRRRSSPPATRAPSSPTRPTSRTASASSAPPSRCAPTT